MSPSLMTSITTAYTNAAASIVDIFGGILPMIAGVAIATVAWLLVRRLIKREILRGL